MHCFWPSWKFYSGACSPQSHLKLLLNPPADMAASSLPASLLSLHPSVWKSLCVETPVAQLREAKTRRHV